MDTRVTISPGKAMENNKASKILSIFVNSVYWFICNCSFPEKKRIQDDLGTSVEASNHVKLVKYYSFFTLLPHNVKYLLFFCFVFNKCLYFIGLK